LICTEGCKAARTGRCPSSEGLSPRLTAQLRPLGITALEDKIVQRAVATVLAAVYEADFKGFSYGFRPGRGQHDALDALSVGIVRSRVNWVLDADIRSFFDKIDQAWLIKFLKHRIGDERMIRLVSKWLKAGVLEEGVWSTSETGTPQGAVISPLLANVFLHYVYDLWAVQWRQRQAKGQMITVRYADDVVAGLELEVDAIAFWDAMRERFKQFALELHEDKTRRGGYQLQRKTRSDRMRMRLREIKVSLRQRMHAGIAEQGQWLQAVVRGYFGYHAVPTNSRALVSFRKHVIELWRRTLRRRSHKDQMTLKRMDHLANTWLPAPRILHPWPSERFAVRHPRWEPSA
jgi:RNA-directed DNA polymerase